MNLSMNVRYALVFATLATIFWGCGEGENQDPATSLALPARSWMGTYAGTQPSYTMLNANGEPMVLYGTPVVVSATSHTITLDEEGAAIVLANDEDGTTYRYRAAYGELSEDLNGMVSLTLTYEDKEAGNRQSYGLNQVAEGMFDVSWGGHGAPSFVVRTTDASGAPVAPSNAMPSGLPVARIEEGRSNVNVRETAPSGRIVRKVDGGLQFTINDEKAMSDPMHLLKEPMRLVAMDGSKSIAKAANAKLDVVGEAGNHWVVAVPDNSGGTFEAKVPKGVVTVSRDSWYRSDELGGWVYSGLCERLDDAGIKIQSPATQMAMTVDGVYRYSDADVDLQVVVQGTTWASQIFLASGEAAQSQGIEMGVVRGKSLFDESGFFEVGSIQGRAMQFQLGSNVVTLTKP